MYVWSGRDGYRKAWNNQVENVISFISKLKKKNLSSKLSIHSEK